MKKTLTQQLKEAKYENTKLKTNLESITESRDYFQETSLKYKEQIKHLEQRIEDMEDTITITKTMLDVQSTNNLFPGRY